MKKYIYIAILLFVTTLCACDERVSDVPESVTPKYQPTSEAISIAELKTLVEPKILGRNSSDTNNNFGYLQKTENANVLDEDGNRKIISFAEAGISNKHLRATIVGNDESGNIYKQFYLQDETGGILVIINMTGVYALFRVGQEVIVELDNLSMGKYYGAFQIGCPVLSKSISSSGAVNYGMNRLTPRYFYGNIHRNNDPDSVKVESLRKTYTSIPVSTEPIRNTLVHFDNVSFERGGIAQFAPMVNGEPATGTVKLNVGATKIDVRTSGYANFAADTVPAGTGSVTAILSQYFETLQITIRGREDLHFNKK